MLGWREAHSNIGIQWEISFYSIKLKNDIRQGPKPSQHPRATKANKRVTDHPHCTPPLTRAITTGCVGAQPPLYAASSADFRPTRLLGSEGEQ